MRHLSNMSNRLSNLSEQPRTAWALGMSNVSNDWRFSRSLFTPLCVVCAFLPVFFHLFFYLLLVAQVVQVAQKETGQGFGLNNLLSNLNNLGGAPHA